MTVFEYQTKALALAVYGVGNKIIYPTLGISGEAGEVAEKVKKVLRDKNGIFDEESKKQLLLEVGDVLWYINALARDLDSNLEEVMLLNIDKLESRHARGVIHGNGDNR